MSQHKKEVIIQYRFKKALDSIEEAEFLFEHKFWNSTVNKLYYSCFYAVGALLASIDVFPKTHSGTRQMFSLHFIKTGIIPTESYKYYDDIFEMRQEADYEDAFDYEKEDVIMHIEPAKELVMRIQKILFPQ